MLLRSGYDDLASEQFERAIAIDPNAAPVLREAARCELRRANFDLAYKYLKEADNNSGHSIKETALIIDLWIQYYQSHTDFLSTNGALTEAEKLFGELLTYLKSVDFRLFDKKIIDHLLKVEPAIRSVRRDTRIISKNAGLLVDWINTNIYDGQNLEVSEDRLIGELKVRGRRDTYGFLETRDGREFFIAAGNTTADVWRWLQDDGAVEFSFRTKMDGRTEAFDVERIAR
jgi:tetratricopeptide (TPR) repeat protein